MINKTFVFAVCVGTFAMFAEASHVERVVLGQDDLAKTYIEDEAEFELELRVQSTPEVVPDHSGKNFAQVIQFDIAHRKGVLLEPHKMRAGDMLLEPFYLLGPGNDGDRVEYLPAGHVLEASELLYINSKSFRQTYDAGGAQLQSSSFKIGDTLMVYSQGYDASNSLIFNESGFMNTRGETLIPNGTVLAAKHIAMLNFYAPYPARVRQSVELDLETYLRVDWPDHAEPKNRQFWVYRSETESALLLYSYQIKVGDKPLADIRKVEDRQVVCQVGIPLSEKGPKNSLEALDLNTNAVMLSKKGLKITSVDPMTGDLNDKEVEPGQLILAPRNEGEYLRPFVVHNQDELNSLLSEVKYSLARGAGTNDEGFPFNAYLTQYSIPFLHDCMYGCDARLEISEGLLTGEKLCNKCNRELKFRPYVFNEINTYPFEDTIWKHRTIHCVYCQYAFEYGSAHALAGSPDGMVEYPLVSLNMLHPSSLRTSRLFPGTALTKDVTYYQNGKEIVIPTGTVINEELRMRLEERATSPIYISQPKQDGYEAAQCPRCYGWNAMPNHVQRLKGKMEVDEVRRGLACFANIEGRANRMDFVVFGLSSDREPVSGRGLARVVTFRRYGDEHFRQLDGWKKTDEYWAYLPSYQRENSYQLPMPLKVGVRAGKKSAINIDDL